MKKAFTLIELLIVLVIIGILASIAVPQYEKMMDKAKIAEMKSTLDQLAKAIDIYYMEAGKWPGNPDLPNEIDEIPADLGVKLPQSKYFYYNVHWHVDSVAAPGGHAKAYYKGAGLLYGWKYFEISVYADEPREYCCYTPTGTPHLYSTEGWPF